MKKSIKQSTMVVILNALSIIAVIATIIALLNLQTLSEMTDQANLQRYELTFNANRFMDGSAYLTNEVRAFAASGDTAHYDNYWNEIYVYKNRDIGVARMKEIGITPEEQDKIDAMAALSNNLVPLESDSMDWRMEGRVEEAIEAVYGSEYEETIGQIRAIKEEFLAMLGTRSENHLNEVNEQYSQMERYALIFVIVVAALQIANVSLIIIKMIVPIKKLEREMEEIAKGNLSSTFSLTPNTSEIGMLTSSILTTKTNLKMYIGDIAEKLHSIADGNLDLDVEIDYEGDFSPIKTSLLTIIGSLNDTITRIITASQQVSIGSKQIADGAQVLSQGATEQASSVEELSTSIAEIAAKTKENATTAENTSVLSEAIMEDAEKGNRQMLEMITAVNEINEASKNISKIIKAIDDIAFQTNILALNAAVEAARAGQHGKGFAVVAEEVRNLASKSAEAAKNTGNMIQNSVEKTELGTRIAEATAVSLREIVAGINEASRLVAEIAKASDEQAIGITLINTNIDQVSQVVQQNSATAQESAAASEEMNGQADMLRQLISQFRLKDDGAMNSALPAAEKLHKRFLLS